MQSQCPSAAAQLQHTVPPSSPLSVPDNHSSPLIALHNVPRDTSPSPLPVPDTTRSPSSTTTSMPHSPLTPINSSPRSFRSFSSREHDSDSHSLLSASPLTDNSPGGMSSHSRLSSSPGITLLATSPTRSSLDNVAEFPTPVVGSILPRIINDTPLSNSQINSGTISLLHTVSPQTSMESEGRNNVPASPTTMRASPPQISTAQGGITSITCTPNSTATSAALPPRSPARSPNAVDSYASPKPSFPSPTNTFIPAPPIVISPQSTSRSSDTALRTFQTSPSLTLDYAQLQSPSAASRTTHSQINADSPSSTLPGAAAGTTGTKSAFSPSFQQPSETASGLSLSPDAGTSGETDIRTPNVYINGLPPNFPEEELFKMTREFGIVISVRTFTRHVCDKPSGYGFVLFETIDAADKCIEALRKYRNLHPSFSKQVHKIPGTIYSSPTFQAVAGAQGVPADSFKARMEQLKDNSSTNLYMEGLPLTIDEMTLAALVKPHKICSSRFFQTRLSNPPRMIAFVRFESRVAAEEIIERLHGRVIRGLEDSGARISVRFADTTEQRELRRMERTGREGEQSPGRISMAQAALLNLKGGQVHPPQLSPIISPDLGLLQPGASFSPLLAAGHISPQAAQMRSPLAGTVTSLPFQQQQALLQQRLQGVSLAGHVYDDFSNNGSLYAHQDLRTTSHLAQLQDELLSLQEAQARLQLKHGLGTGGGMSSRADNGFTAMERMLLQAHAQRQQEQELFAAQAQHGIASRGPSKRRLLDALQPNVIEEDFHSSAAIGGHDACVASQSATGIANVGQRQRNQTHATSARLGETPSAALGQALHLRSTTMPSQYLNSRALDRSGGLASNGTDRGVTINTGAGNMFSVASMNASKAFSRKPSIHNIQSLSAPTLPRAVSATAAQGHIQSHARAQVGNLAGDEDTGQLASPGLTFSPRTPATLSPATPFGGFFHAGESFEGSRMVGVEGQGMSISHHELNAKSESGKKMGDRLRAGVGFQGLHG